MQAAAKLTLDSTPDPPPDYTSPHTHHRRNTTFCGYCCFMGSFHFVCPVHSSQVALNAWEQYSSGSPSYHAGPHVYHHAIIDIWSPWVLVFLLFSLLPSFCFKGVCLRCEFANHLHSHVLCHISQAISDAPMSLCSLKTCFWCPLRLIAVFSG